MQRQLAVLVIFLLGSAGLICAEETPVPQGVSSGPGIRSAVPRRDAVNPPPGAGSNLEAQSPAEDYANGQPMLTPDLKPSQGAPLLGEEGEEQADEETLDRRFGLLARPWNIRPPRLTRNYLRAQARATTGLPPYLQEVERAGRSPAGLYESLTQPVRVPRSRPPDDDDVTKPEKPIHVW